MGQLFPGIEHLHNLHPLTVHFPLAFLLGAAVLYAISWWRSADHSEWAAYWVLMLGFVSCTFAVATGFYAYWEVSLSDTVRRKLAAPHMDWMILTYLLTVVLATWAFLDKPFPRAGRKAFMALMLLLMIVLTRGVDYGSRLVYDYNASGNAVSRPVQYSK